MQLKDEEATPPVGCSFSLASDQQHPNMLVHEDRLHISWGVVNVSLGTNSFQRGQSSLPAPGITSKESQPDLRLVRPPCRKLFMEIGLQTYPSQSNQCPRSTFETALNG